MMASASSISSAGGDSGGGRGGAQQDLSSKYNKLAAEYAKLRAQLPVLKRAVLDEQGKTSELTSALQLRDQSIRKLEQEVDSLNFRNKQLEKRIGVLQNELGELTAKAASGKGKKGQQQGHGDNAVGNNSSMGGGSLDYELIAKIEENILLQKRLSDLEQASTFEIETLRSQLESLNNEETHKELILNELTELKSENHSLTFALQNSLDEIEAYKEQVQQMKERIASPVHNPVPVQVPVKPSEEPATIDNDKSNVETETDDSSGPPPPQLLEKLTTAEKQKAHIAVEYQLLKMKYDRIFKKWEECRDIVRSLGKEDLLQTGSSEVNTPVVEPANLLGKIEVTNGEGTEADLTGKSYEKEVKEHMLKKINELVSLLQHADSRAVHFYNECKTMQSLLSLSSEKHHNLEEDLSKLKALESVLKEELDLTKENCETQLTQLSEHVAIMNDKLAEKQELINELQLKLKGKR